MVRSLDASAERRDRVLDILVGAGRALTLSRDVEAAVAEIADAVARNLGGYCEIQIAGRVLERNEDLRVTIGSPPSGTSDAIISERLSDGRRTLGSIACRQTDESDETNRKVLQILATELGVVLAGQALIRREHHVADRLQRALLPEQLPTIDGAEFSAAYRPASDEAEVGGDWYDAFPLHDGRVAISVGDVAGHGLEAAVIMGEVRQAIRTAAVGAAGTTGVLDYVNRIILLRKTIGVVTAIFAVYDPAAGTLSYATAGHPPPLLALANGLVRALPSGSLPLGCTETIESQEWTFTIPEGGRAIFYTDGLIENDRDLIAGEKHLIEVVREIAASPSQTDPALAVQTRIFEDAANRDDAAILVLSRTAPVASYVFSAVPIVASIVRAVVGDQLAGFGFDPMRRFGILVALGEAVANAIEHAYRDTAPGLIRLETASEGPNFVLSVEDFGRWRPFVRREERGRGIEIMHAFMDGVQIRSTRESTQIVLKTQLA